MISYFIEKIINLLGFDFEFNIEEVGIHLLIDLLIIFVILIFIFVIALIMKIGGY